MYAKINRKRTVRYPGTDNQEWKVVTFAGEELSREEMRLVDAVNKRYEPRVVRRWSGYKTAARAAKALGGVAVRA